MANRRRGIFCLEGDWNNDYKRPSTVRPVLELIDQHYSDGIRHIYKDVHTREELIYLITDWRKAEFDSHSILYLGFHGDSGLIYLSYRKYRNSALTLEELGELLAGRCKDRIVVFASCATLKVPSRRVQDFLRVTGAKAVCGYSKAINWTISAAFEVMLFSRFQSRSLTPRGVLALKRDFSKETGPLWERLGFRIVPRGRIPE